MAQQLFTNRQHLTTTAYGDSANLAARIDIYRYQKIVKPLYDWALDQLAWRGDERVIDVGCGNGSYLRRLVERVPDGRVFGFDLSRGMLADVVRQWNNARALPALTVADVQALPLRDESCDVALAMHMLYHVPDMARAARELRRVVRSGGVLLAVTNSQHDKRELSELFNAAVRSLSGQELHEGDRGVERFSLENGASLLQSAWSQVERYDLPGELRVPMPEPMMHYIASTRATRESLLPQGVTWAALEAELERRIVAHIAAEGVFRIKTLAGVFVCR